MATTLFQAANISIGTVAAGLTRYTPLYQGGFSLNATESNQHRSARAAGTLSKLWCRVGSNTVAADSTVRTRIAGANGNQSVTVGAGATDGFGDATNTDTVGATDKIDGQCVAGAGGTDIQVSMLSCLFTPSTNTFCLYGASANLAGPATSTTYYYPICGSTGSLETDEVDRQVKMTSAGTLKQLWLAISTNANASDTVVRSRINAANGNMTATATASTAGTFEDTSNTDAFVADDLVNFSATTGASTGGNFFGSVGAAMETTDDLSLLVAHGPAVLNAAETRYFATTGRLSASTTETPVQGEIPGALTVAKLQLYVVVGSNTLTAASTLRTRVNAGNGNQSLTVNGGTHGWFTDASNTDALVAGDDAALSFVAGGTGSTIELATAMMTATGAQAAAASFDWLPSEVVVGQARPTVVSSGFGPPSRAA